MSEIRRPSKTRTIIAVFPAKRPQLLTRAVRTPLSGPNSKIVHTNILTVSLLNNKRKKQENAFLKYIQIHKYIVYINLKPITGPEIPEANHWP